MSHAPAALHSTSPGRQSQQRTKPFAVFICPLQRVESLEEAMAAMAAMLKDPADKVARKR